MAPEGYIVPIEEQASIIKKTAVSRTWAVFTNNAIITGGGGDTGSSSEQVLDLDKYAIMHRVSIHARDLRILDPLLSYPSAILGRERAIVINLEHIKAIITAEEVLLRDPLDDNVVPVVQELRRRLSTTPNSGEKQQQQQVVDDDDQSGGGGAQNETQSNEEDDFPFEFRAMEVILEAICSFLDARTSELETDAYPALDELTSKISSRNLDRVRKLKSAMTRLTNRVQKVRDELEQLLDDDDDMEDMYLSRKLAGGGSPSSQSDSNSFRISPNVVSRSRASRASVVTAHEENDVEELEMLLEAYFMQMDSTLNKLTTLREYINDTEDYINIQLDNHRNQLIQMELLVSSLTLCLSVYSLVAAVFGMNIPYTWNTGHSYMFKWVVTVSAMVCGLLFLCIMTYARHKGLVGS